MQSHRSLHTDKGGVGKVKAVGLCAEGCWGGKVLDLGS